MYLRYMKYTKEKLEEVVKASKSYTDVCNKLGIKSSTGSQTYIGKKIKDYELDTSHFIGQDWRKGSTFKKEWVDVNKFLVKGSKITSHKLKLYLIREDLKPNHCESCKNDTWLGKPIVLELDHMDSDHTNNELSNLQVLCSNCHATFTRERIQLKKT